MMCTVTTIANPVVNFCLIPETDFTAEGLLKALERRFASGKAHTVIVVAEGAGQRLIEGESAGVDASGNVLKKDIGEGGRDDGPVTDADGRACADAGGVRRAWSGFSRTSGEGHDPGRGGEGTVDGIGWPSCRIWS